MEEQKTKKREWVKTAAIIFLTIMLLLTFFSNTILNRSLPEVSAQYVSSGTINAKIRGSGTVTANQSYQVILDESREISAVCVKVGDAVNQGDILFMLGDKESSELETAMEQLDTLNLSYQKALLNATSADYAQQNYAIQQKRAAIEKAQRALTGVQVTDAQLAAAQARVQNAASSVQYYQQALDNAQAALDALGGQTGDPDQISSLLRQYRQAEANLKTAKSNLTQAQAVYGNTYNELKAQAVEKMTAAGLDEAKQRVELPTYMAAIAAEIQKSEGNLAPLYVAWETITNAEAAVEKAETDLNSAKSAYQQAAARDNSDLYAIYKQAVDTAKSNYTAAQKEQTAAQKELEELQSKKSQQEQAESNLESLQGELEQLLFDLAQKQKSDQVTKELEELDLANMRKEIAKQKEKVAELQKKAVGATVTANVSGVISSISAAAGSTTVPGSALAVIDVVDQGYTVQIPVTLEQSKKVRVGDTASVSNWYWGNEVQAVLTNIANDPSNPGKGKLLVFTLSGDVEPGSNLSLSVGQRSAEYDAIVPKSAIRTDNNGSFVLAVTVKSTPLNNRYIATRVDVQVLASDDVNVAISGLSSGEYVITTASRPLKAGDQVRMVENQ